MFIDKTIQTLIKNKTMAKLKIYEINAVLEQAQSEYDAARKSKLKELENTEHVYKPEQQAVIGAIQRAMQIREEIAKNNEHLQAELNSTIKSINNEHGRQLYRIKDSLRLDTSFSAEEKHEVEGFIEDTLKPYYKNSEYPDFLTIKQEFKNKLIITSLGNNIDISGLIKEAIEKYLK